MNITRRRFLNYSGLLTTSVLFGSITTCSSQKQKKPNIIILFSDELPPEYLGCYGGPYPTPHIDSLAAQGVRFTNAYAAAPMCTPSRFALLTGQYPGRCSHPSFLKNFPENEPYFIAWNTYLDESIPTIARLLAQHGYYTGMAGKWHIGKLPQTMSLPEFNEDDDPADEKVMAKLEKHQEIVSEQVKQDAGFNEANSVLWGNFDTFPVKKLRHHNFPWITKGAIDFIEEYAQKDKPFFLYAATTAVHGPHNAEVFDKDLCYTPAGKQDDVTQYALDPESMKSKMKNIPSWETHRYSGMSCLDNHIGIILQKIRDLNIEKNTLVFYMPDHNIEPGKATCYERGFKVPLIVKWPGQISPDSVNEALVQSVDIFPTLLEAAGIELSVAPVMDGMSMLPLFRRQANSIRNYIYYESGYARGISKGRFKYIAFRPPKKVIQQMINGSLKYAPNYLNTFKQAHSQIAIEHYPFYFDADQLYELENDPYEQNNLADDPEYRKILTTLKAELKKILETFNHPFNLADIPFMKTERYRRLTHNTRSIGTDFIPWLARDHGAIVWPPK